MNKNELLIFQAAQLLQEIRIDRRDARQVRRKVVAAFELLRQAGYEFDEEYIQEYIKHCQIDGRHARNAALNYNDLLNSLSQPKEYYEKLLRSKQRSINFIVNEALAQYTRKKENKK